MVNSSPFREKRAMVAGEVYRDLDGSLVRLLEVKRDLCSWVPINGAPAGVQVTHADNFRRRFRSFDSVPAGDMKRSA